MKQAGGKAILSVLLLIHLNISLNLQICKPVRFFDTSVLVCIKISRLRGQFLLTRFTTQIQFLHLYTFVYICIHFYTFWTYMGMHASLT
jgi:hypothetical protein